MVKAPTEQHLCDYVASYCSHLHPRNYFFQLFLYVLRYIFVFLHLYLNVDMNDLVRFESLPEIQSPEEAEEIIQQKE